MKLRLTPLNIISSIFLISIGELLLSTEDRNFSGIGLSSLIILFVISFIADQLFRRLIPEQKRIWLFELVFLIFVAVLMTLIRVYFYN